MKKLEDVITNFSKRVKEYLKNKNISIAELSRLSGIPRTTINGWLTGTQIPTLYSAYLLADYLNVSIDYLAGRKEIE